VLLPVLANIAKPLTKAAIKGSILLYEKGRESFAELSETVDDLVAEVKSEMEVGPEGAATAASAAQATGAQGKTGTPSAQPRLDPDTRQSTAATAAVQPSDVTKMSQSPPAPTGAQASEGQRDEGAQGRPPTKGE
jgi:hypothetical protein